MRRDLPIDHSHYINRDTGSSLVEWNLYPIRERKDDMQALC